jgi:tRNA nucleotidyltransferase (CCA-adding enzyme)
VSTNVAKALARVLAAEDLEALRVVGREAWAAGSDAFLVGGTVRDALLGIPSRDLDVVVEGDATSLAARIASLHGGRVVSHERFGTASTTLPSGASLDLAEARSETYERPGALPAVARAGLERDLARRDFTVNAMAVRIDPERFGVLIDPLGGRRDLRDRRVRVLHPASFLDDPTRAFRALALCARHGFRLERETARLLRAMAREGAALRLSRRRLGREIEKLFGSPHAARAASWLGRTGLLATLAPTKSPPSAALRRSDRALRWLAERLPRESVLAWTVPVAILTEAARGELRRALVARLAPERKAAEILMEGPERARRLAPRVGARSAASASGTSRACRGETVEVLLLAGAISANAAVARRIRRYLAELRFVRADVTGRDLLESGIEPGPRIARGLAAALDAKLDRRADRSEQLRAAVRAARST